MIIEGVLSVLGGQEPEVPFEVAQKVAPIAVTHQRHDLLDAQQTGY